MLFQFRNCTFLRRKKNHHFVCIMLDWAIKVSLLFFFLECVSLWVLQRLCIWPLWHWNHQGGKNISVLWIFIYSKCIYYECRYLVNGMIKCFALVCWDQGLFGNAVCTGSQGWVTPEARERERGRGRQWEREGEMRMRPQRLICINASWMNISTSCTNYCIASACDQGHGKEPGKKQS